jgi:hypothetical protein
MPITHKEVWDAIADLRNGGSPGPDGIPNCVIKKGLTNQALHIITIIFQVSFTLGYIPKLWKNAQVRIATQTKQITQPSQQL